LPLCNWSFKADCSRQIVGDGYGQSDRDLHTEELPETVEMDSTPPTRKSHRVLLADEEISLAQNSPLSDTWWASKKRSIVMSSNSLSFPSVGHEDLKFAGVAASSLGMNKERDYDEEVRPEARFAGIVGRSPALREVLQLVEMVASTDSTVLLLGETGTGKELIARAIHDRSRRRDRALVKINCAAIPGGLLESELFGHERGSFTGAIAQKIGRVELADQGSLFLDEIGDSPLELQPKLLRVLQEQEFERLGSTRTKKVNVRVVAATHRNLEEMIQDKQFRSDLYYRLNVFPISIPPLRERQEDIPLLVWHFVRQFAKRMNKTVDAISSETMQALTRYPWPGNIRELQNVIERSVVIYEKGNLSVKKSWLAHESFSPVAVTQTPFKRSAMEDREMIGAALAESSGRVSGPSGAAAKLGIPPSTLESKIRSLNINKYSFRIA
jgi:formate hydrogenlyase transcriptional activator